MRMCRMWRESLGLIVVGKWGCILTAAVKVFIPDVSEDVTLVCGAVRTVRTREGPLPRVRADVACEVDGRTEPTPAQPTRHLAPRPPTLERDDHASVTHPRDPHSILTHPYTPPFLPSPGNPYNPSLFRSFEDTNCILQLLSTSSFDLSSSCPVTPREILPTISYTILFSYNPSFHSNHSILTSTLLTPDTASSHSTHLSTPALDFFPYKPLNKRVGQMPS